MQINRGRLTILSDSRIQDGHHEIWEQEYVAGIIAAEVDRRDINTVCLREKPTSMTSHLYRTTPYAILQGCDVKLLQRC